MSEELTLCLQKLVVSEILISVGWSSSTNKCLNIMSDLLGRYINYLTKILKDLSMNKLDNDINISMIDVEYMLKRIQTNIDDIIDYTTNYKPPLFIYKNIPTYPLKRKKTDSNDSILEETENNSSNIELRNDSTLDSSNNLDPRDSMNTACSVKVDVPGNHTIIGLNSCENTNIPKLIVKNDSSSLNDCSNSQLMKPAIKLKIKPVSKSNHKKSKSNTPIEKKNKKESIKKPVETPIEQDNLAEICPFCNLPDDGSQMLCCDRCDQWIHFNCTNLKELPSPNIEWFCSKCTNSV